jgi:hypothetical protein
MSYQDRIDAFTKHARAAETLANENTELFLSVDVRDAFSKVRSLINIRESIEPPQTEQEAYNILADLLGEVLRDGKTEVKAYGLSTEGRNEFRQLVSRVTPAASVQVTDPTAEYADVIEAYSGPTSVLNQKMLNKTFRSRFDAAVAAGVI